MYDSDQIYFWQSDYNQEELEEIPDRWKRVFEDNKNYDEEDIF